MRRMDRSIAVAGLVALLTVVVACSGCGGGGGGPVRPEPRPPEGTGIVKGQVVFFDYPDLPPSGVVVRVGNTETQTGDDGRFEAYVRPGTYTVTVVPPEGFALPPGPAPTVTVGQEGETVTLSQPIVLITSDSPPNPPSTY